MEEMKNGYLKLNQLMTDMIECSYNDEGQVIADENMNYLVDIIKVLNEKERNIIELEKIELSKEELNVRKEELAVMANNNLINSIITSSLGLLGEVGKIVNTALTGTIQLKSIGGIIYADEVDQKIIGNSKAWNFIKKI